MGKFILTKPIDRFQFIVYLSFTYSLLFFFLTILFLFNLPFKIAIVFIPLVGALIFKRANDGVKYSYFFKGAYLFSILLPVSISLFPENLYEKIKYFFYIFSGYIFSPLFPILLILPLLLLKGKLGSDVIFKGNILKPFKSSVSQKFFKDYRLGIYLYQLIYIVYLSFLLFYSYILFFETRKFNESLDESLLPFSIIILLAIFGIVIVKLSPMIVVAIIKVSKFIVLPIQVLFLKLENIKKEEEEKKKNFTAK